MDKLVVDNQQGGVHVLRVSLAGLVQGCGIARTGLRWKTNILAACLGEGAREHRTSTMT